MSITNSAFQFLIILLNVCRPWQLSLQNTFEIIQIFCVSSPMKLEWANDILTCISWLIMYQPSKWKGWSCISKASEKVEHSFKTIAKFLLVTLKENRILINWSLIWQKLFSFQTSSLKLMTRIFLKKNTYKKKRCMINKSWEAAVKIKCMSFN